MKRLALISASLAVLAVMASSCGAGVGAAAPPTLPSTTSIPPTAAPGPTETPSNLGGDRLPVQVPGEIYGHYPTALTGILNQQSNGCWTIDVGDGPHVAVFPAGYVIGDTGVTWLGPDGTLATSGMAIDATGGLAPVADFPGFPDGYWGNYLTFCDRNGAVVVVLDSLEPAFDPKALSDKARLAIVRTADLSVSWGCGLGFTISTPDQRVALAMYPTDAGAAIDPPIAFPAPDWKAVVTAGKNLLANHCDDVVEGWEPVPVVAGQWELTTGTLSFTPPAGGPCSVGEPVEASLVGATITVDGGTIQLPDLALTNDAYGCFAG